MLFELEQQETETCNLHAPNKNLHAMLHGIIEISHVFFGSKSSFLLNNRSTSSNDLETLPWCHNLYRLGTAPEWNFLWHAHGSVHTATLEINVTLRRDFMALLAGKCCQTSPVTNVCQIVSVVKQVGNYSSFLLSLVFRILLKWLGSRDN